MATTSPTRLDFEIRTPVARIVLNNSPLNVIDLAMTQDLQRALTDIESRSEISVIVVEGHGSAFSAGVDIKSHHPDRIHEMLTSFHAMIKAIGHHHDAIGRHVDLLGLIESTDSNAAVGKSTRARGAGENHRRSPGGDIERCPELGYHDRLDDRLDEGFDDGQSHRAVP